MDILCKLGRDRRELLAGCSQLRGCSAGEGWGEASGGGGEGRGGGDESEGSPGSRWTLVPWEGALGHWGSFILFFIYLYFFKPFCKHQGILLRLLV